MADYSQGAQGALGGAATGAAAGSAFGPWGTVIGAGLGGLTGFFTGAFGGGDSYADQLERMEEEWRQRGGFDQALGEAERGQYSDFRSNQAALIAQLEALSRGQGPSLAAQQMREAIDRSTGAQASMAAGAAGSGIGAGAAYRNAANQMAAIQAQGARDTGMMRAQEQLGALGQLGGVIGGARGADEAMGRFNAAAANQFALARLDAQLQMMGLNDRARLQALQLAMSEQQQPGLGSAMLAGGMGALGEVINRSAAGRPAPETPAPAPVLPSYVPPMPASPGYYVNAAQPNYMPGPGPNWGY
jgi:hypothetical protein